MSSPTMAMIPVYLSRFTPNLPEGYGSFICWEIGERVILLSKRGRPPMGGTVMSDMLWHDQAPEIDSARGRGRWIREVRTDDDGQVHAIAADQITFGADPNE